MNLQRKFCDRCEFSIACESEHHCASRKKLILPMTLPFSSPVDGPNFEKPGKTNPGSEIQAIIAVSSRNRPNLQVLRGLQHVTAFGF